MQISKSQFPSRIANSDASPGRTPRPGAAALLSKYRLPAPRYTSYPTVPYWEDTPDQQQWSAAVLDTFRATNNGMGISLYIHLPFCESLCTYCACNTRITVNHRVEKPYIDALLAEWELYCGLFDERPRISELHLGGGTPTFFSAEQLDRLIRGILSRAEICPGHEFSFEGHPNNTTAEHLQALYSLGFRRVSYGIQDLDPVVQDAIHRHQPLRNVERAVADARRIGYTSVNFDLVYGLPFQTVDSVQQTVAEVIRLAPERIAFYSYAHVPWLKPGQRKFTEKDLPVDREKRALYEAGLRQFKAAGYADVGMDHFAKKTDALYRARRSGRLHRNFMGYTAQHTQLLIGLGASSISDTGTTFGQNIKSVEEYQAAVREKRFPITKGHLLSEEDRLLRRVILDIMCRGHASWSSAEEQTPAIREALERCRPLAMDGLINFWHLGLTVTRSGTKFLRTVGMCFDARYWRKVPDRQIFSGVA